MADSPVRLVHADLSAGLPELGAGDGRPAHVIWWWRGVPLGQDELRPEAQRPRPLADRIGHTVAGPLLARTGDAALETPRPLSLLEVPVPPLPAPVSLAVCTRGRPDDLRRCLASLAAADPAPSEVVVVDNGPDAATRAVVAGFPGVRYIAEPRRGLSAARNAAIAQTTGEILAFLDDDATVRPDWLGRLCAPLDDPRVLATTGNVLPAELETEAQYVFETMLHGLGKGYAPRRFDAAFLADGRRGGPRVWEIGAGCNMAFRRRAFALLGGFDERLGAGAAGCSEDSELWHRVLAHGWACAYEPASVVFHRHRRERAALDRMMVAYIRGHVAALFVQYGRHRDPRALRRAFVVLPWFLARQAARATATRTLVALRLSPPRPLAPAWPQVRGYARGLVHLPLAVTTRRVRHKAALRDFLRQNPFPRPYTEGFFYREKMRAIHRVAPDEPVARVLEIGGGRSGLARMLFPHAQILNTDIDPEHARAAMNDDPRVTFEVADATALPYADGSFDVVTLLDVLEHIPDDAAAAREALRVLRPGGWVLVSSPNLRWRSPYHRVMRPISPTTREMMDRWVHVRLGYDEAALARLFGAPPARTADFITPVTVVAHDLAFSRLPARVRRAALLALSPVTWAGYALQRPATRGTETAASWRKPAL